MVERVFDAVTLDMARQDIEAFGFVILEIDGRMVWPRDRWQDAGYAFYIGKKGSPAWDTNAWVEVPLPDLKVDITREQAMEAIQTAITAGLKQARAQL